MGEASCPISAFRSEFNAVPLQTPIILVGPPHAHKIKLNIIIPNNRGDLSIIFFTDNNYSSPLKITAGFSGKIYPVGEMAHIPPIWITNIVVICHHDIQTTRCALRYISLFLLTGSWVHRQREHKPDIPEDNRSRCNLPEWRSEYVRTARIE